MKPKDLINERDLLIGEIKNNWKRINLFNVVENSEERHYDIEKLYEKIVIDSMKLVEIKVGIQAINMGLSSLKDLPQSSLYPTIYTLQQLKEQKTKLLLVPTKGKDVILTRSKIKKYVSEIEKEIILLSKIVEDFNNDTDFEVAA